MELQERHLKNWHRGTHKTPVMPYNSLIHIKPMTDIQKVKILVDLVKKTEYYVPRNYQTIGGMWTTDTYERDCVRVQVMDEGYSTSVSAENLRVFILWDAKNNEDYIRFEIGNVEVVENLLKALEELAQGHSKSPL